MNDESLQSQVERQAVSDLGVRIVATPQMRTEQAAVAVERLDRAGEAAVRKLGRGDTAMGSPAGSAAASSRCRR